MKHFSTLSFSLLASILLTLLWLGLFPGTASAQEVDWARSFNGDVQGESSHMAIDADGNLYVTGQFVGTATFGDFTLTAEDVGDIFFAKFDNLGNVLYAKQIKVIGVESVDRIAVDNSGNSYITGEFGQSIDFGTESFTNTAAYLDGFLAKFDANGNFVWALQFDGRNSNLVIGIVTTDDAGNAYLMGEFSSKMDFGSETLTSAGYIDTFIAKYNANGNLLWLKQIKGFGHQRGLDMVHHDNQLFVTGTIDDVSTFDTTSITPFGSSDIFLAAYDDSGALLWTRHDGGVNTDRSNGLAVDNSGNILMTGNVARHASFGPIPMHTQGLDGFIAKFDAAGTPLWAKSFGGPHVEFGFRIGVDAEGNAYITGGLTSDGVTIGTTEQFGNGFFVAKYDADGNFVWAEAVTSPNEATNAGLAVASSGYAYITGDFFSAASMSNVTLQGNDLGPTLLLASFTPGASEDAVFSDSFESGNFSAWTNYSSDFGDLAVDPGAALVGNLGLRLLLDDRIPIGMRDEVPNSEERYRARFYLDPNDFSVAEEGDHVIFFGYSGTDLKRPVLRLEIREHGTSVDAAYSLRAALFDDGTTWRRGTWQHFSDEPHLIELDWHAANADGTNDGSVALLIDESLRTLITGVDNDTRRIDTTRLGAIAGIDPGTLGVYFIDDFVSHRQTYIGPTHTDTATIAAPVTPATPSEVQQWTEVDESDPEEAALMQEVLEYAEQVAQEAAQEETPPDEEEQSPRLFLPYINHE